MEKGRKGEREKGRKGGWEKGRKVEREQGGHRKCGICGTEGSGTYGLTSTLLTLPTATCFLKYSCSSFSVVLKLRFFTNMEWA